MANMMGGIEIPASVDRAKLMRAMYDITRDSNSAGGRKRRPSRVETGEEESILKPRDRNRAINLSRSLLRNSPQARGMSRTLRMNVIGDYGKLQFNNDAADEWFPAAQRWFNGVWARNTDFIDGITFRECLQIVVTALAYEGDLVCVFDDGTISGTPNGTGKLVFFEADQICQLVKSDFAPFASRGYRQDSGIIFDNLGRQVGVIVSSQRGVLEVEKKQAWVLMCDPDDRDAAPWRLVKRKFRLRQARGSAEAIPALQTMIDSLEMLGLELQTAKVAASRYATVEEAPNALTNMPLGFDDALIPPEELEAVRAEAEAEDAAYDRMAGLEEYTGGNIDYAPPGTKINFDPTTRPNAKLAEFLDYTTDVGGAPLGLMHAYARGRADTSYTAFRGDMIMTWMSFRDSQQFLEDSFSDWVAVKALTWAVKTGALASPPDGWSEGVAWQYPRMPAVDEDKEQSALTRKLRNGMTTFRDELGPAWREKLKQYGEEVEYIRQLNLPLVILETVAGAPAENTNKDNENEQE